MHKLNLSLEDIELIRKNLTLNKWFYTSSVIEIAKQFLSQVFGIDTFNEKFEKIYYLVKQNVDESEKGDIPTDENKLYLYIAKTKLLIEYEPRSILADIINEVKKDLNDIENNLKRIYERRQILLKKIKDKDDFFYQNEDYELRKLDIYEARNEELKREILEFIRNQLDSYVLSEIHPFVALPSLIFLNIPYTYSKRNLLIFREKYNSDTLVYYANKYALLGIIEYRKLIQGKLYFKTASEYIKFANKYIEQKSLLEKIKILIKKNHILFNKNKEIIKALDCFIDEQYYLFIAIAPVLIEGIFYDLCIATGIDISNLEKNTLGAKVEKLNQRMHLSIYYDYYMFYLTVIRNKIAHGGKIKYFYNNNRKVMAVDLFLDLFAVCELTNSEEVPLNKAIKILTEYFYDKSQEKLFEFIDFLDLEIPEYYYISKQLKRIKYAYSLKGFWEYIDLIINTSRIDSLKIVKDKLIKLKELNIEKARCKLYIKMIGDKHN